MKKDKAKEIEAAEDLARNILTSRQQAYHQIFSEDKSVFAKVVLEDLADFCRANQSTFHADPRLHAVLEGRREVWLRISDHLGLQSHELQNKVLKKWGIHDNRSNTKSGDSARAISGTAEQLKPDSDTSGLGLDSGS